MDMSKRKICIICEGHEEKYFMDNLINKIKCYPNYIIESVNAKGNGNLFARYQDRYSQDKDDLVLIFCDTERKPYESFESLVDNLKDNYEISDFNDVICFSNPTTLLLILNCFKKYKLTTKKSSKIKEIVRDIIGIEQYNKKEEKVKAIQSKINKEKIEQLRVNIKELETLDHNTVPGTNFLLWDSRLSSESYKWIEDLLKNLMM